MSKVFAITTLIELVIAILLIIGFMYEKEIVWFEQNVKRIVIGNTRRIIRKTKNKIQNLNGEYLLWKN